MDCLLAFCKGPENFLLAALHSLLITFSRHSSKFFKPSANILATLSVLSKCIAQLQHRSIDAGRFSAMLTSCPHIRPERRWSKSRHSVKEGCIDVEYPMDNDLVHGCQIIPGFLPSSAVTTRHSSFSSTDDSHIEVVKHADPGICDYRLRHIH
ncbi:hypothetical protein MRB53_042188 [Persea americana]|nr:hypothetical protein MRB53_042188 [Persea americana]